MHCLNWALIPAAIDDEGPHGNQSYVSINGASRGQMNAWSNPKRSPRESQDLCSDMLVSLPVLHQLCMLRRWGEGMGGSQSQQTLCGRRFLDLPSSCVCGGDNSHDLGILL